MLTVMVLLIARTTSSRGPIVEQRKRNGCANANFGTWKREYVREENGRGKWERKMEEENVRE